MCALLLDPKSGLFKTGQTSAAPVQHLRMLYAADTLFCMYVHVHCMYFVHYPWFYVLSLCVKDTES